MKALKAVLIAILITAIGVGTVQADWETRRVNDDYDDLMITTTGGVFQTSPWVEVVGGSSDLFNYYAFRSISIPNGSVILNASLEFEAPFPWNWNQSIPVTITGLKEADLDSWNPAPDLNNFPQTSAQTNWDAYDLISSHKINVTVTSIIQEIYDQYLWEDGNDMGIKISAIAVSGGQRFQVAHDADSTKALKLYIEYGIGGAGTVYYKGYTITQNAGGEVPYIWGNSTANSKLTTYVNTTVIQTRDLPFTMTYGVSNDGGSRDPLFVIGSNIYAFSQAGNNMTIWETSDRGDSWSQVFTGFVNLADIIHLGSWLDDTNDVIHVVWTSTTQMFYWNISLPSWTHSTKELIKTAPQQWQNIQIDGKLGTNNLYVAGGTVDGGWAFTRLGGVWTERGIDHGTAVGVVKFVQVEYNPSNDLVVWSVQLTGAQAQIAVNVTGANEDATNLHPTVKPYVGWRLFSKSGVYGDVGTLATSDNQIYVGYNWDDGSGDRRVVVTHDAYTLSSPDDWDQANVTDRDSKYIQLYGDKYEGEAPTMDVSFILDSGTHAMYSVPVDFFQGQHSQTYWSYYHVFTRVVGGIYSGQVPRFILDDFSWVVVPPTNGTPPNPNCIALAVTLEDVQACIDDALNDTNPFNPNPPSSNYPEHESFGRFDIKYYIWVIGQLCIFAPMIAVAYRRFPYVYYPMFIVVIMIGLGLLWSLSGM